MTEARRGWDAKFADFSIATPQQILLRLKENTPDASVQQVRAWRESIPQLQTEVAEVVAAEAVAESYTAILEYQLPMEFRRADAVQMVAASPKRNLQSFPPSSP